MQRREFIGLIGGVAAWPLAAQAQKPGIPVIGFLHVGLPQPYARMVAAFLQGLSESGFVECEFRSKSPADSEMMPPTCSD